MKSLYPDDLSLEASRILDLARKKAVRIATAESCTGGLISGLFTEIAGSSDVFDRGFVTYSNEAKVELLGVPEKLLKDHGAVSEQVAQAMAEGALSKSNATVSAAVTGIAGPGGGSADKPVGLVHIAAAHIKHGTYHQEFRFGDIGRSEVRIATVKESLAIIVKLIEK